MKKHHVRVYPSKETLKKEDQLAYKFALVAKDHTSIDKNVENMIINRVIDNASVAIASVNRSAVSSARAQALCHPRKKGSTVFGLPSNQLFSPDWATWANNTAIRELDFHDTFLAADYSHPADNIPAIIAVAQRKEKSGEDILRAIATSYEIHVSLVKAICLHKYKKDHIAHLTPSIIAGLGSLLDLDVDTIYNAINQGVHLSFSTRQSRKGEISSWKAYAPAFAGKLAIESIDRAMRGEKSPSPIYEGEDSVIAYMLGGAKDNYDIFLPEKGESKKAILETYTKEHSAEYQAQALIDLAFKLHDKIKNLDDIKSITLHTSHHTHYVIGTGSGDPQKLDPMASRETLDHSIMYIFAVALEDKKWHHIHSYTPERARRKKTIELWKKIKTKEDSVWTKKYHNPDSNKKAFGARAVVSLKNGKKIEETMERARAHPAGERPFKTEQYVEKFHTLTEGFLTPSEKERFLDVAFKLPRLKKRDLLGLNVEVSLSKLENYTKNDQGIF